MRITVWLESSQSDCWTISETQIDYFRSKLPSAEILHARSKDEFIGMLSRAETAICWFFHQDWFASAPKLRYIVTPAAGLDYFTVDPPSGVEVINSSFQGPLIAETVLGMMLSHARGISLGIDLMKKEAWPRREVTNRMRRLAGSHLVVLGFGNIGGWIARRAKLFGCRITGIRRRPRHLQPEFFSYEDRVLPVENLREVLPTADHLVIALPRTPETDNIIGRTELSLLQPHAALYNVGRGNAVDEEALIEIMRDNRIGAAFLDVFAREPLPPDSPLRDLPGCYLMPHSCAASPDYFELFIDDFTEKFQF
ncbi:MAG: D-2-hydroxyacid dehydrogenase [Spirochaetota bacterium]|nr:D-2-hydroxyacid dehydrogenase [Spirochaetota bacterium]